MTEEISSSAAPLKPLVKAGRRLSPIWIIPLIAAFLGLWLGWEYNAKLGETITVSFETAEGITENKTLVMCRSVKVGTVEKVQLAEDLKGVEVTMQMTREATRLLTDDAQIWVVRARYGFSGISGLSTLASGSYIELEPGLLPESRREFVGLEQPPETPKGILGLRIKFHTDEARNISPGSPIFYKGLNAGKIETSTILAEKGEIEFGAFISLEFAPFVRENTKFWNASGIDVQIGADGFELHAGTLESLLLGGINFGLPEGITAEPAVEDGATFELYDNLADTKRFVMSNSLPYLLLFSGSVRGLKEGAPVEFRGVRIGTVNRISFSYYPNDPAHRVPVLVQIDPGLITSLLTESTELAEKFVKDAVQKGLRASLKIGSYITGQLYVDLDFQKDAPTEHVTEIANYRVIPTRDSFNPVELIEETVKNFNKTLGDYGEDGPFRQQLLETKRQLDDTMISIRKTLGDYGEDGPVYQKLTETLSSIRSLASAIERKPNSLIFGKPGVAPPKGTPQP